MEPIALADSDDLPPFDSILVVSFGGPEGPDDVMPFLENVLRGKNVPHERMLEVAEHYNGFGGVSPITQQNRALIAALREELDGAGIDLPIYFGNRNWHPLLPDTLRQMKNEGKKRAIAFFTSMFSCYSGCRQYRENIAEAQKEIGEGAPLVQKVRMGFNHPSFIEAQVDLIGNALGELDAATRAASRVVFTAHSIPMSMADNSRYEEQLRSAAGVITSELEHENWTLVYQSRSGPPHQPWLEPDVCDHIAEAASDGVKHVLVVPLGFISDHMEVLYDLDTEAKDACAEHNIGFTRVPTTGVHPSFVRMIRELIEERVTGADDRPSCGSYGPSHDACPADCCLYPRPARPGAARPVPTS